MRLGRGGRGGLDAVEFRENRRKARSVGRIQDGRGEEEILETLQRQSRDPGGRVASGQSASEGVGSLVRPSGHQRGWPRFPAPHRDRPPHRAPSPA